jgi:hypothetical protein
VPRVVCRHGLEIKDGFGWWECSLCVKDNGWTREQVNEAKRDLEKSYRELRSSRSRVVPETLLEKRKTNLEGLQMR